MSFRFFHIRSTLVFDLEDDESSCANLSLVIELHLTVNRRKNEESSSSASAENNLSSHMLDMSGKQPPQILPPNYSFNYDFHSMMNTKQTQPTPQPTPSSSTNLPFVQQFSPNQSQYKNFSAFPHVESTTSRTPMQNWRGNSTPSTSNGYVKFLKMTFASAVFSLSV